MNRSVLSNDQISPAALKSITSYHVTVVEEVKTAVQSHPVVVVGMAHNPFVRKVRKALSEKGIHFQYLEYGSYWRGWKQRLAIKLWSGWPTYPQVFVEGKLVGGFQETAQWLSQK